jgi:phage shock protein PspC (stress-responsive transcriptional regulator)/uncharacterized membrane protein
MNKVLIINLNGNAYQLEENGYEALRTYLDAAGRRLEGNPDRDEIIADIEQAIADKFRAVLGVNKTVVATRDVEGVIAAMGPVEDASGATPAGARAPESGPQAAAPEGAGRVKRLYKINDGAMLCGVCNGLAAHFGLDVTIVRIVFVLLTVLYGFGGLAYVVMAFLMPSANTPAEKAAAFGGGPSTSQEFIRRARAGYYEGMKTFGDKRAYREWRRKFRQDMRGWKQDFRREFHQNAEQWRSNWHQHWASHPHPSFGGWLLIPILTFVTVIVALVGIVSVISLLAQGSAFGIVPPADIPVWGWIIILILAIQVITWPLKAMRHSLYYGSGYRPAHGPFVHLCNALVWVVFILILLSLARHHSGRVHEAINNLPPQVHQAVTSIKEWWAKQ